MAIRGELSDTFFADAARQLGDIIADYELQAIPDTGHFPPMEKPQESANLILDFVDRKLKSIWNSAKSQQPRWSQFPNLFNVLTCFIWWYPDIFNIDIL